MVNDIKVTIQIQTFSNVQLEKVQTLLDNLVQEVYNHDNTKTLPIFVETIVSFNKNI